MYLARLKDKRNRYHYMLRHSYPAGDCYRSRDLFDLGRDPSRFIRYPGGNGFYIDTSLQDALADIGVEASQSDLESVFMPFLDPQIRRVIDGFDRGGHRSDDGDAGLDVAVQRFDLNRLCFLKTGCAAPRHANRFPRRFYAILRGKSRDEIEYDFITAERDLKPHELARYVFEIFELQRHFHESFARTHPEWLDASHLDREFIDALCRLNDDRQFWLGFDNAVGLNPHLVRYAVMYFDNSFPNRDPLQAAWTDFVNRHRVHRPPERIQVSLNESARLFGISVDALKQMDRRSLTRQYRKLAMKLHPDQGGDADAFVKLGAAYEKLLKRKPRF